MATELQNVRPVSRIPLDAPDVHTERPAMWQAGQQSRRPTNRAERRLRARTVAALITGSIAVRTAGSRQRSGDIRAWATQHGLAVSERGHIPASVVSNTRPQAGADRDHHRRTAPRTGIPRCGAPWLPWPEIFC